MTNNTYTTRAGKTQFKPVVTSQEMFHAHGIGFCLACGTFIEDGIEPDARQYMCESCEQPKVYGLEELLIMNLVILGDQPSDT